MTFITLPRLTVEADGQPLPEAALVALTRLSVHQQLALPTLCELVFVDPPGPLDAPARLAPGTRLRLSLAGGATPLFVGQVTGLAHAFTPDGERQVRVHGYDALHALRKRGGVRAHVQVAPAELAAEMVGDLGLAVEAAEPGPVHSYLIQGEQSDFDFLGDLLARCGLYAVVRDGTLHLLTLAGLPATVALALGETLLEARAELNGERVASEVTTQGWNPLLMESFSSTRGQPRSSREVVAAVAPADVDGDGVVWLLDEDLAVPDHVEGLAQAELDHRAAGAVTVQGVALGDPALQPGTGIALSGLGESVSGRYTLTAVTHRIDPEHGYLSRFDTAPPPLPARARGAVASLGVVSQVDDPDGMGRVRVTLPAFDGVETDWMQVVAPAAGVNKGLVALPGVDDNVLVLFTRHNPAQGLVLGGIYGPFAPYDPGVAGGDTRRYTLRTPRGHLIRLDDDGNALRVEHRDGSYVEMTPDKVLVHAEGDLELTAPGHQVLIRGAQIDFERG